MYRGKDGLPRPKGRTQIEAALEEMGLEPERVFATIYIEEGGAVPELIGYYAQVADDETGEGFCTRGYKKQETLVEELEALDISITTYA